MTDAALRVDGLTKSYGTQKAIDELSFEVPWGRVTGFLGPNGAGKTTTLRMLLGLVVPSSGLAHVMGKRYADMGSPGRVVGALLETHQFHPQRTARNHLRIYAAASSIPDTRVDEVLEMVELSAAAHKRVGQFSLGMHQRLGLAAALLGDPRVLILDEPSNGLDPGGIRWLRSFVRSFVRADRAVFLSSHLLAEMTQMADEVVVIDKGRLVIHAPVNDLLANASAQVRARAESPEQLRERLASDQVSVEMAAHDLLIIRGATAEEVGRAANEARIPLFSLETEQTNLEDVFFDLTSEGGLK